MVAGFDNLTPVVAYTDEQAVRDGDLIDPAAWGGPVPFKGGLVTRWTRNLHEAMQDYFSIGWSHVPPWGVIADVLAELLTWGVADTACPGEPKGRIYATPVIRAFGADNKPIWLVFNGGGFTAMFPSDY